MVGRGLILLLVCIVWSYASVAEMLTDAGFDDAFRYAAYSHVRGLVESTELPDTVNARDEKELPAKCSRVDTAAVWTFYFVGGASQLKLSVAVISRVMPTMTSPCCDGGRRMSPLNQAALCLHASTLICLPHPCSLNVSSRPLVDSSANTMLVSFQIMLIVWHF